MSLAVLADHMASKGRNGDTMLVHMAPEEVRGLHALAAAHGGELTINPETGLPEANFLKRLLPTIIGAGISWMSGGTIDPMTAAAIVGGVETVRTGDLGRGISAGLGAYGGASFTAGLSTAGSTALAGSPEAIAAGQAAAGSITPEMIAASNAALADAGMGASVTEASLREAATREAVRDYASNLGMSDKVSAGLRGLTEKSGRDAFMDAMGGGKGLFKAGYMAAAPLLAAEATKAKMPQTTTPMARITPYGILGGQGGDYTMTGLGSYTPEEFIRLGGFQGLRERVARGELTPPPPPGAAGGGLMSHLADGGVPYAEDFAFAQRSEPVVRMANGGFTDERVAQALRESMGQGFTLEQSLGGAASKFGISQEQLTRAQALLPSAAQVAAQQSIVNDPQAAALAAARSGIAAGLTNQQIADQVNTQYGKNFSAKNVADFMAANSTQLATPTAAQLAAQQSIVNDPQAAALAAVRGGITAGMTNQQIADMVNMQYGKSFNAQNVADFMAANRLTRPASTIVGGGGNDTIGGGGGNDTIGGGGGNDTIVGGDTIIPPYVAPQPDVTVGTPFQPTAQTMEQVRSAYVQGGGRTDMPTITNIQPTDRTYTYNEAFGLLKGYLQANPNAMYRDVVAFARSKGIPEMQAKAAYNEFRFSGLTGGSQQAYDYLMGRGAAPTKPFVPGGGPISRSYAEAMGITGGYQNLKPVTFTTAPSGARVSEAQRSELGNRFVNAQKTGDYSSFNTMLQEMKLTAEDLLKLYPALTREGIKEQVDKGYVKFFNPYTDERESESDRQVEIGGGASGGVAQDIPNMARGGLSALAALGGAAGGGSLGGYSDGGRLLRGPGDGVSDSIPAVIGNKRPARLADGEFVVPARIVSELGNGSTEAGARKLYAMMDRVQAARRKSIGKGKVAKNSRADKYLPA